MLLGPYVAAISVSMAPPFMRQSCQFWPHQLTKSFCVFACSEQIYLFHGKYFLVFTMFWRTSQSQIHLTSQGPCQDTKVSPRRWILAYPVLCSGLFDQIPSSSNEYPPDFCQSMLANASGPFRIYSLSSLTRSSTSQQGDAGTWPYFSTWHQEKRLCPEELLVVLRERGLCSVLLPGESASSQYGRVGHVGRSDS